MNVVSSAKAVFENLRVLNFAMINGVYTGLGTPYENPARLIKVSNTTDVNLIISFNGVDDKDFIAANSGFIYDFSSDQSAAAGLLEQAANTRMYIKAAAGNPTLGNVYLTVIYASQV